MKMETDVTDYPTGTNLFSSAAAFFRPFTEDPGAYSYFFSREIIL